MCAVYVVAGLGRFSNIVAVCVQCMWWLALAGSAILLLYVCSVCGGWPWQVQQYCCSMCAVYVVAGLGRFSNIVAVCVQCMWWLALAGSAILLLYVCSVCGGWPWQAQQYCCCMCAVYVVAGLGRLSNIVAVCVQCMWWLALAGSAILLLYVCSVCGGWPWQAQQYCCSMCAVYVVAGLGRLSNIVALCVQCMWWLALAGSAILLLYVCSVCGGGWPWQAQQWWVALAGSAILLLYVCSVCGGWPWQVQQYCCSMCAVYVVAGLGRFSNIVALCVQCMWWLALAGSAMVGGLGRLSNGGWPWQAQQWWLALAGSAMVSGLGRLSKIKVKSYRWKITSSMIGLFWSYPKQLLEEAA